MKISISRLWLNPLSFILSSYYSILSWYGNFLQKIVDPERYALNEKVHDHLNNREYSIAAELWKHSGEIEKAADASFSGTLYFFDKYRMKKALWDDFAFLLSDTLKYYIDLKNFYAVKNISKFFLKFAMINDDRIGNLFFYFNNGLQRDYLLSEIIEEFCEEN